MNSSHQPDRTSGGAKSAENAPSVLDLVALRTGEAPRVTLRDEDSAATASPLIDPTSPDKSAVPVGRSNYQFLGEIARGGMGVILKGHDTDLGRDVAVKVLDRRLSDRPEVVQRFIEEAQIGGQLQHPGIVPVYELGTMKDERPFFTMKLVKGRTLATLLSERESLTSNRRRLIDIFESICQTMAYAHSRGVVHRDLKPANIMVGAFGEVQVVDWGLAKVLARGGTADEKRAQKAHTQLTVLETVRSSQKTGSGSDSMVGSVMGTPAYMPPEQASGHVDRLDERSDVFALGAILCEILTGLPPYVGEREEVIAAAAQAQCDGALERLDKCGADPDLIKLTKHCLLPAAAARPANAGVLAGRVHEHIVSVEERAQAARAESAAASVRAEEERKARRLTLALGAAVVTVLLVAGGGLAFVQNERIARERDRTARLQEETQRDTRLRAEVGDALAEASVHEGAGHWAEAIRAAERARALAEGGGASSELQARVDAVLVRLRAENDKARLAAERDADNQRLVAELLEAREPEWDPGRDDPLRKASAYEDVFAKHGLDVDAGSSQDFAAGLKARGLGSEIALFLDSLAEVRRAGKDEAGTGRVLDVAHVVDPDPLRADLREALAAGELGVLREIMRSGFEGQPAITIELLGSALQQLSQRELARQVYRTGIERFPDDFSLQYRLGRLLTPPELDTGVREEMEEAVECYRAALALRPASTVVRYYLGRVYFKLDLPQRALEQFLIALKQRPNDGTFLFHISMNRIRLGQVDEALAIARELAERTDPNWLEGWASWVVGRCFVAKGEPKQAVAYFERAVASNRGQAQFQGGLYEALLATSTRQEWEQRMAEFSTTTTDDPEVLNNVAWALTTTTKEAMRDLPGAIRMARRSIALRESDASWNTLGVALYYDGDYENALEALRNSMRLQGAGNVVDWLFTAMAYRKLGRDSEARVWYERAVMWMNTQSGVDPEFVRFRVEADALMMAR
ncbi:MAG TPA: protein kinase [Planctomycetota bacterium]|nr:protein kinase [Planctomycetota bacterium]